MKENKKICSECGAHINEGSTFSFDGKLFCEECFNKITTVCDNCGERIYKAHAEGDSCYTLCHHCYEYSYTTCEDCGRLIHNENAFYEDGEDYPYCRECFEKLNDTPIKNYSYKPEPIFYGSGNLFYGVELELDKGGENHENARQLIEIANSQNERIYTKHDGSIHDGFEVVSHPMSLDYHINSMNWNTIFEKAVSLGYRSHQTQTCGYHIHVSRAAFGKTYEEQEEVIGRIVFFVEKHWNELVKFSRRNLDNLNHWAAKYATISDTTNETYQKAKEKCQGRYVAVNLENPNTIEFRMFRGTLRYKTFIATLQLVDEIIYCAVNMTDSGVEEMCWSEFVQRILPNKPELVEYLKEKRLYVNEVTTESEEM